MREIQAMLDSYRQNPKSLAAPDIPRNILTFLETGVTEAVEVRSHRSDPLFAYGSDKVFRCKNSSGQRMTIMLWGNTDGWGMVEMER